MRSVSLCSLLCLLLLLVSVDGQRYFTEVLPTTEMWAARDKANVELVRRTTTFRDGVNGGRATTLTNYMVTAHAQHSTAWGRSDRQCEREEREEERETEREEGSCCCCCCLLRVCHSVAVRRQHGQWRSERWSDTALLTGCLSIRAAARLTQSAGLPCCVAVWASVNGRAWVWVAGISDGQDHPVYADTFPNNEEAAHCQDTTYRQYRAGGRYPGQEPSNDGQQQQQQ